MCPHERKKHAGGMTAISRWSSEGRAIPPDSIGHSPDLEGVAEGGAIFDLRAIRMPQQERPRLAFLRNAKSLRDTTPGVAALDPGLIAGKPPAY
jgi:hypothetical protein